jgi:hypothetical protein
MGADPAMRPSLASVAKRSTPAISPMSLAAMSTPQPGSARSWRDLGDEDAEFALQGVDGASEFADASQLVAGDEEVDVLLGAAEAAGDALLPAGAGQDALGDLELGPEVVQVPAQVVDQRGALGDEPLAMIGEQPDLELGAREPCGGQGLKTFAQRGASDHHGVDRV